MKFKFIDTDAGRNLTHKGERRDCIVRAIATCLEMPYPLAHTILERAGRKPQRGWFFTWHHLPIVSERFQPIEDLSGKTVATALREVPPGRYVFKVARHVFTVIKDETDPEWPEVLDTFEPTPRQRLVMVYRKLDSRGLLVETCPT